MTEADEEAFVAQYGDVPRSPAAAACGRENRSDDASFCKDCQAHVDPDERKYPWIAPTGRSMANPAL